MACYEELPWDAEYFVAQGILICPIKVFFWFVFWFFRQSVFLQTYRQRNTRSSSNNRPYSGHTWLDSVSIKVSNDQSPHYPHYLILAHVSPLNHLPAFRSLFVLCPLLFAIYFPHFCLHFMLFPLFVVFSSFSLLSNL